MSFAVLLIFYSLGIFIYFIPTIVGLGKRNIAAIFIVNLFLGWTFFFWIVALIMAVWKKEHIKHED